MNFVCSVHMCRYLIALSCVCVCVCVCCVCVCVFGIQNLASTTTWDQAMKQIINDPRYMYVATPIDPPTYWPHTATLSTFCHINQHVHMWPTQPTLHVCFHMHIPTYWLKMYMHTHVMCIWFDQRFSTFQLRALKKLNEKKQVFNMYKTQKAKEEKVSKLSCHHHQSSIVFDTNLSPFTFCRKSSDSKLRRTRRSYARWWKITRRSTHRSGGGECVTSWTATQSGNLSTRKTGR